MARFAACARRYTLWLVGALVAVVLVTSAVVVAHMSPPCNVGLVEALSSIAGANFRTWTSNYLEASLVFFALAIRTGP
jgi:hypothetical protein